jgi:hypothetical protein|tara:strand:- start:897 stop:1109 length:213 start_codon:yes stop_codon:yes gene_type:complete
MYRIGSVIEYQTFGGTTRTVLVEEREDDIKNGRPGFDGKLLPYHLDEDVEPELGKMVWGYDNQITKVIKY